MPAFPSRIDLGQLAAFGFMIEGEANYDQLGFSVSSAGDVNGDGFDDLLLGAPQNDSGAGAAYILFGKASGFADIDLAALSPSDGFRIRGDAAIDFAGWSVSSAGDINADGFDDFIIGASRAEDAPGDGDEGAAYVIFGNGSGFSEIDLGALAPSSGFIIEGVDAFDLAGSRVSSAGDVNGDGFDDLLVAAYNAEAGENGQGETYVIFGKAGGFTSIDLGALAPSDGFTIRGQEASDQSGFSAASAGDINNDGFDDLIIGAPLGRDGGISFGEAYVVFGKASGFADIDLDTLSAGDGFIIRGGAPSDQAGASVASAGDVNADGFADIIIGAPGRDDGASGAGAAYVLFGKASGFANVDLSTLSPTDGFAIVGDAFDLRLGSSVAGAGDVNGDGFDDVLVGANFSNAGGYHSGLAYVVYGRSGGFATVDVGTLTPLDGFLIEGEDNYDQAGRSISAAGDLNGDGFDDLVVGAPYAGPGGISSPAGAGRSYVIFGNGTESTQFPLIFDLADDLNPASGFTIIGDLGGDNAGFSASSAGDINNDGIDDIIVGAPLSDVGGLDAGMAYVVFGRSTGFSDIDLSTLAPADGFRIKGDLDGDNVGYDVASAGDVNGDGYDDLIVGAPRGDDGGSNAGEAYVIFGKAAGFADIDLTSLAPTDGFIIQGDGTLDLAGYRAESAGDVNGDGFDDIIVGAFLAQDLAAANEEGEAYIIFGRSGSFGSVDGTGRSVLDVTGLAAADGFTVRGDLGGDQAGLSVASAGDINGDGFGDIVVGATGGDNGGAQAGEAYVLFGKASGFADVDLGALTPAQGFIIQGDLAYDFLGIGVASAGDINGDGIDDLVVGASGNDAGGGYAGAAYVIFGKSGAFSNIDLSALAPADGFVVQGDAPFDLAGFTVASAGDVNGDGFDDILVGALQGDNNGYNAGEAYVIYGRPGGFANIDLGSLLPSQGFIVEGAAVGDQAGSSVAAAGDVNGDGFDDIIIGAKGSELGGGNAGSAHVIFGRAAGAALFPLVFDLGEDINPVSGATIIGDASGDDAGFAVSSAGDVNGDGLDDVIVGARYGDNGGLEAGEAYVVFGKAGGIGEVDLGALTLVEGFIIQGNTAGDKAGSSVSSAGDVNGDGFDDILIGAAESDIGGTNTGEAYLIFGKAAGFADIDVTTLAPADGFIIRGDATGDWAGHSLASAGDVNGDGFDDFIVGAYRGDNGGTNAGEAYVIFGKAGTFGTLDGSGRRLFDLTGFSAADGFIIQGDAALDWAGFSVSSAGDINDDGYDDILVGAPLGDDGGTNAGEAYVIFGKSGGFANIDLTALAPADGFVIRGDLGNDQAGWSVSSAQDVNGDGFDDLLVGANYNDAGGTNAGAAYVVFGKSGGFANIDLSTLASVDGFAILGASPQDRLGSVSRAGDVNGDGFDDIIVGTDASDLNGTNAGAAYILFGKPGGFATVDLASLSAADGFIIAGAADGDFAGTDVSAAGDVNGDGFDDLIVGARNGDLGGTNAGEAYIVHGRGYSPQDDVVSVSETGTLTGNLFDDNGSGADFASSLLDLDLVTVNGSAANVGSQIALPSGALLTVQADGSFSYDTNGKFDYLISAATAAATGAVNSLALDSFTYAMPSGRTATVTVTITGIDSSGDELWGDAGNNVITGTSNPDLFRLSQGGNDTATGQASDDDFIFGATFTALDSVNGSGGFDELFLTGNYSGSPLLFGTATLTNVERIILGSGFSYSLASNDTTVGPGGTLVVDASALTLPNGLVFIGSAETNGHFQLIGGAGVDDLTGGALNDTIDGSGGADTLRGGLGNDTYVVDNGADQVVEAGGAGTDVVQSSATYTLADNVEKLVLTGTAAINGTGNGLANEIKGNNAANQLNGGIGGDQMTGGQGNDTYVFDNAGDKAVEKAGNGTDTILSSVGLSVNAGVENVTLTGAAAINATGNGLDNLMIGNGADNELNGSTGADEMRGGAGNDTYTIDNVGDVVVEGTGNGTDTIISSKSLTLGANVENLTLSGTASTATGNGLANILRGNELGNTINGAAGADELRGGAGDDLYIVDNGGDTVIEGTANGTDTVQSSVSFSLGANVENLTLTGAASINGTGNGLDNEIVGNNGNNQLNGGAGVDELRGGVGDDSYFVDNAGDVVVEGSGNGADTISSSVSYTLSANVENLVLTGGSAINGTGNGAANTITGNGSANILSGSGGADQIHGGGGNDDLSGGGGADGFRFDTALNGSSNVDDILDFNVADDTIFLDRDIFTGILANGTLAAGAFRNGTAAVDADDRILYDAATGQIRYDADGSGGAAAILFATVTAGTALTNADFVGYI